MKKIALTGLILAGLLFTGCPQKTRATAPTMPIPASQAPQGQATTQTQATPAQAQSTETKAEALARVQANWKKQFPGLPMPGSPEAKSAAKARKGGPDMVMPGFEKQQKALKAVEMPRQALPGFQRVMVSNGLANFAKADKQFTRNEEWQGPQGKLWITYTPYPTQSEAQKAFQTRSAQIRRFNAANLAPRKGGPKKLEVTILLRGRTLITLASQNPKLLQEAAAKLPAGTGK